MISVLVTPQLAHANAAVVLSAVKVLMKYMEIITDQDFVSVLARKLAPPLVTLLSSEPEVQYVALCNINLIVQKRPDMLKHEMKVFFVKYNDPIYVKLEKLDIMIRPASQANIAQVLAELKEYYAAEVDVDDAACRVLSCARLTKEVTAARAALATLKPPQPQQARISQAAAGGAAPSQALSSEPPPPNTMQEVVIGVSQDIHQKVQETAGVLTQERKRKAKSIPPPNLATGDDIKEYKVVASHTGLHSASSPGILCLDVCNDVLVTGGSDKVVSVFNKATEQIVASLKGHTTKVTNVNVHPVEQEQLVMSGSMDATARIWHIPTSACIQHIAAHDGAITGLSLHATGDYLLLSSLDRYWSFVDLRTGAIYAKVLGDEESSLTSAKFHPDGLIFAFGTVSADVKIWDLKDQQNVATFTGHQGPVTSIAFSENGYYLATAAEDYSVKLWDLRKLKNFKTIQMEEGFSITDVAFDYSGSYLALSGNDVRVYGCKTWNEIAIFNEHAAVANGVRFGPHADWIASVSMDRSLKIYATTST